MSMTIDPERLRELASDPNNDMEAICTKLGMSNPTFYGNLKKDPELKRIYKEGRAAAGRSNGSSGSPKPKKKSSKKAKSTTPPRNAHTKPAKATMTEELLKQVACEFQWIDAWGEVSERFDELRAAVSALV